MIRKSTVGCLLFALTTFGWAADWPQWHGPNRDNVSTETGLLAAWPAAASAMNAKTSRRAQII